MAGPLTAGSRIIGDGGHAKVVRECISARGDTFIAVGDNRARKREAEAHQGPFAVMVHPSAVVSPKADIGDGTVIMAGAVVQAGALIGRHCIVNTCASVDHDCVLEDYVHIAPDAHLCGNVRVGEGTLVAVGASIAPNTKIPAWSIVKASRLQIEPL